MSFSIEENKNNLPVLALRGLVLFPNTALSFDVVRKRSLAALKVAMEHDRLIFAVTQRDLFTEDPQAKDLYEIGCVAKVRQILKVTDEITKVVLEGVYRATADCYTERFGCSFAEVYAYPDKPLKNRPIYVETALRRVKAAFDKFVHEIHTVAPDIVKRVASAEDIGFITDYIAFNVPAPYDDKQYILEQNDMVRRAKLLVEMLDKEREIAKIDHEIGEKTKIAIDENQRDYYLREQMKIISNELYGDDFADEIDEYHYKIEALKASDEIKDKLHSEVVKLAKMPQGSHEGTVVRGYLDTCLALPWNSFTDKKIDLKRSERILNRDIYGMDKVKERILEMLSVYTLAPDLKGQILCLVGPPGVGKTSIGKTIAECMGRNFARISLGGVHDEAEIRGHRKTYIGAMPGKIMEAVKNASSGNPLLLLDEVDKLGNDYRGDPSSALLEVLDPEQNNTFVDHFIEIPYDLSKVVFIATANTTDTIPAPLLDRMEVIELTGYTREEKFQIAKRHLIPRQISRHGLTSKQLHIADSAVYALIDFYTREAGVRKLERTIASLCRKSAKRIAEGENRVNLKASDTLSMLGKHRYKPESILGTNEIGIINGLAWTQVGGEIMQLEVSAMPGTGKIELTGSLGNVMQESAKAAVSYVRANASRFSIDPDFYKNCDIHIHATEAAVPKDGPSAGVTMTVGLVSALAGLPVRRDVAMTGEVTIRGRVLPIGGLKEKSMAAHRGGVKTVFIPKENIPDLDEIDPVIRENLRFVPVSYVDDIISAALIHEGRKEPAQVSTVYTQIPTEKTPATVRQ